MERPAGVTGPRCNVEMRFRVGGQSDAESVPGTGRSLIKYNMLENDRIWDIVASFGGFAECLFLPKTDICAYARASSFCMDGAEREREPSGFARR